MANPQNEPQQCPLCQVTIQTVNGQDQVMFSRGGAGTRSKLWGRVCQFLRTDEQKGLCINQDSGRRGTNNLETATKTFLRLHWVATLQSRFRLRNDPGWAWFRSFRGREWQPFPEWNELTSPRCCRTIAV